MADVPPCILKEKIPIVAPHMQAVGDVDGLELGADYIPLQDLPSISASELLGMGLGYADAEIVRALNFLPEQK